MARVNAAERALASRRKASAQVAASVRRPVARAWSRLARNSIHKASAAASGRLKSGRRLMASGGRSCGKLVEEDVEAAVHGEAHGVGLLQLDLGGDAGGLVVEVGRDAEVENLVAGGGGFGG